jgi:hypothetical protein
MFKVMINSRVNSKLTICLYCKPIQPLMPITNVARQCPLCHKVYIIDELDKHSTGSN